MTEQSQAGTYARALMQNVAQSVASQLEAVSKGLRANPELRQVLGDPTVEFRDKAQRMMEFLPANTGADVQKFVQFLLSEGAIDQIDAIVTEVTMQARGGPRAVEAVATSAVPLTEREQAELRQKLAKDVGENLDLSFEVDPEVIGGMILRVGDRVVDASVATRLRQLRESILRAL